jgi:MOSC domain-containing protein YiiM
MPPDARVTGTVVSIHLASRRGAPMAAVAEARAVAGAGLEGDRFFAAAPPGGARKGCEITLIETETVEAAARDWDLDLDPGETRRNLVTRGIALDPLVGRTFRAGGALLEGLKPCDPCAHLARLTGQPVLDALRNRGGLRARILAGGTIRVGDPVAAETPAPKPKEGE